jgi:hypothetical protein
VAPDLSRTEAKEEGNLLIEAVSLLVQRQRETESWIAEQIWQAEARTNDTDRRYAELEARLANIEEHLARLVHDVEPSRQDAAVEERLTRLREQVEDLKSQPSDGRSTRSTPAMAPAPGPSLPPIAEAAATPAQEPETPRHNAGGAERRPAPTTTAASASRVAAGASVGLWQLLGATPQDRFGVLLIFAGAVAVLYALLLQLRF